MRVQQVAQELGHVDPGESDLETAFRETKEEAGLSKEDLNLTDFQKALHYKAHGKPKIVTYWLAELKDPSTPVTLSHEHQAYDWFILDKACEVGGFDDTKELLRASVELNTTSTLANYATEIKVINNQQALMWLQKGVKHEHLTGRGPRQRGSDKPTSCTPHNSESWQHHRHDPDIFLVAVLLYGDKRRQSSNARLELCAQRTQAFYTKTGACTGYLLVLGVSLWPGMLPSPRHELVSRLWSSNGLDSAVPPSDSSEEMYLENEEFLTESEGTLYCTQSAKPPTDTFTPCLYADTFPPNTPGESGLRGGWCAHNYSSQPMKTALQPTCVGVEERNTSVTTTMIKQLTLKCVGVEEREHVCDNNHDKTTNIEDSLEDFEDDLL
uniref:Bis(5'-nucleosyl)-tetraphosphatase [asymmetrical] n=1 Tax=Timema shepardi TaxID=629360 RepID=A0A7R9AV89_TIMSH|nr:unnamed protein product [Timema shepardi]